ncbi:mRNA decapping protein 2 Box A [Penicillium concentricum]|uniref:mRNA decapping protein 2 Box A n=1 Tax=Penicillium concentricum TaxID=293559 RepID=A0A9W9R9H0_9EURO|nr:mRNA decapping protein 2 Box A [Penicillium concentricum]KAJ5356162.1 mRNA decapping protein 2 Box A [Penicillium concentricum]
MIETNMRLEDWLDDLCVRFIINLPREELESVERICFQVEEAQWFYEDFIRPLDPALPSMNLKTFAMRIFQHCPLMSSWSHYHHLAAFQEFLDYKTRVPVRGAIMLNQDMDEVVLVKGWKKGANWSFPRGKINKGEKDLDCAIREVYEETGFDIRDANLVKNEDDVKYIEITMREQHMRLYVFRGLPRDAYFEPRTRKEISKIEWYKLSELPTLKKNKQHDEGLAVANANKFYMVAPFLSPLKKWIAQQKKLDARAQPGTTQASQAEGYLSMDENGHANGTPGMSLAEMAIPSDLPEVTSAQDASDHLKRLLKIGAAPGQGHTPGLEPVRASAVDPSKASGLLALLQRGNQETFPQDALGNSMVPPNVSQSNVQSAEQRPHLGPNFFPGFPQQQQNMGPSPFMRQNSTPFHTVPSQPHIQHSPNGPRVLPGTAFPTTAPNWYPKPHAIPQFPPTTSSSQYQHHNQPAMAHSLLPPSHMPAPFQRTGDPEFSESAQLSQTRGPVVPPASKLPPPKLTSHSLSLLEVFKVKTPKGLGPPRLAAPIQSSSQVPTTSQHQDSLLGLLKGPQTARVTEPAELLGKPVVPSTAPSEKQILQRPRDHHNQLTHQPGGAKRLPGAGQTSATVSGPLNTPQFESFANPHRSNSGAHRKNHMIRREQPQPQQLSSPITILPRPHSAKREVSSPRPVAQATQVQPAKVPQASEPSKNFQPQILRRSEKSGYEELMATAPQAEAIERKLSLPGVDANTPGLAPQGNFDRRPSQTAEQKASLLSLFSKAPVSPSPLFSTPYDVRAVNQQPAAFSGFVSPISSRHRPSSGDISRRGTPSDAGAHTNGQHVSSPSNKAFLLGFLEGVAKGNK